VASLGWLGVATERRGQGLGTHLLREAENQMREDGALLGMIGLRSPSSFAPEVGDVRTGGLSRAPMRVRSVLGSWKAA